VQTTQIPDLQHQNCRRFHLVIKVPRVLHWLLSLTCSRTRPPSVGLVDLHAAHQHPKMHDEHVSSQASATGALVHIGLADRKLSPRDKLTNVPWVNGSSLEPTDFIRVNGNPSMHWITDGNFQS